VFILKLLKILALQHIDYVDTNLRARYFLFFARILLTLRLSCNVVLPMLLFSKMFNQNNEIMKNYQNIRMTMIAIIIALFTLTVNGQVVSSECTNSGKINELFKNDADRMALRKIYGHGMGNMFRPEIPEALSGTILSALNAVYNARILPARDTVIDLLNIHTLNDIEMNSIMIAADAGNPVMIAFQSGNIRTGLPQLDNLLIPLGFTVESYMSFQKWDLALLSSENNYNLIPIAEALEEIPGVVFAQPAMTIGDGSNIECRIFSDHIELVYSYGWGDCPSGCIYRRFWKFNVYYDCSVEFIDSYGDALYPPEPQPLPTPLPMPVTKSGEISETNAIAISVYPNPMKSYINIEGVVGEYTYTLRNLPGQVMATGTTNNSRLDNLSSLAPGIYLLTLQTIDQSTTFKILKK